jgi:hypothetical protein
MGAEQHASKGMDIALSRSRLTVTGEQCSVLVNPLTELIGPCGIVLKRAGDDVALEKALLDLVQMTEAESRASGWGVAPAWYEELAILYRKRKDHRAEVAILERFASQCHAPGVKPPQLLERLDKARALLAESQHG